jgi:hypothetical protein
MSSHHCASRAIFLLPFGFDNDNLLIRQLDHKIRVVVGDIAARVHVIELEMDGQVVLRERDYVAAILQECGKPKLQLAVTNNAVENAFLRDKVALIKGCFREESYLSFEG